MRFVDVQGFCIKRGKQAEFQAWLIANEDRIRKSYPAGIEYGGIYVAVLGSEKTAGEFYALDFLDSYAALDRGAALGEGPHQRLREVGAEFGQFIDTDRSAGWSRTLLKSVVDATIIDIPTD